MVRALRVCSRPECPNLTESGRCPPCRAQGDKARGTSTQRGYGHKHRHRFRAGVLTRDPTCKCTTPGHGHGGVCGAIATQADHYPLGRDELVLKGENPNDPRHGRGLCTPCHSSHTSKAQPGGWNAR